VIAHSKHSAVLYDGTNVSGQELELGDYSIGRYAWALENPRAFIKPIPASGQQGFWNWTPPEGGLQYANIGL
jgi:hypothetical protein